MRALVFKWSGDPPDNRAMSDLAAEQLTVASGVTWPSPPPARLLTITEKDVESISLHVWERSPFMAAYLTRAPITLARRDWCALVEWWECNVWGAEDDETSESSEPPAS